MNQLYRNQPIEPIGKNPDLLAIRMASVNPILDPWVYILLRKTVVLKLVEKIKYLFCRMGGRRQRQGGRGQFRCADGHLSSSIVSRDSPSLVSRELREVISTSQSFLYPPEGTDGRQGSFKGGGQGSSSAPAVERSVDRQRVEGPQKDHTQCILEDGVPGRLCDKTPNPSPLKEVPSGPKDQALHVTFTDESLNLQEKCI